MPASEHFNYVDYVPNPAQSSTHSNYENRCAYTKRIPSYS